tara:strand:+ start:1308 stop:1832 length:525 start_codon:yes stop_codon:yes gene_type:complete
MNKDAIDILDKNLTKTNDWLKFAEAKNGALIALDCAVMLGVLRVTSSIDEISLPLLLYVTSLFILSGISLSISLASFLPRLKKPFWITISKKKESDNPFYFGDACKYSAHEYLQLLNIEGGSDNKRFLEKAADQIVTNSKIAFMKYRLFTTAAWLFLSAILTPLGALIILTLRE